MKSEWRKKKLRIISVWHIVCSIKRGQLSLCRSPKLGPLTGCSAHSEANALPLREISSSCVNHGGLFKGTSHCMQGAAGRGKAGKVWLAKGSAELRYLAGPPRHWASIVRVCLSVKGKTFVLCFMFLLYSLKTIIFLLLNCVYEWDFSFNNEHDSKSFTSLTHDKSGMTYISHHFPTARVRFCLLLLKVHFVYVGAFFPRGPQHSSFKPLSTMIKHNELCL